VLGQRSCDLQEAHARRGRHLGGGIDDTPGRRCPSNGTSSSRAKQYMKIIAGQTISECGGFYR
jgi:hypothetical protein